MRALAGEKFHSRSCAEPIRGFWLEGSLREKQKRGNRQLGCPAFVSVGAEPIDCCRDSGVRVSGINRGADGGLNIDELLVRRAERLEIAKGAGKAGLG